MITLHRRRSVALLAAVALCVALPPRAGAQGHITTPKEAFGHNFGDDYFLANYKQIEAYWHTLAKESPRMVLHDMGKTPEGRTQWMAIITSPENHKKLARYKEISARLAHAEGLTDAQARALAKEGKAVVWIDGGLHASEVLGAQQLGEMVYQMVSKTDDETMRFLNDVIVLFVHANPDGNDLVADWYMRNPVPEQRTMNGLPRLYQHYIGHENNRDFLASTQMETKNIDRALYLEWFPQILYNHHQSGPAGTVVYSPPLRDPYNYNLDPVLILGLQSLGAAMHTRLAIEGKGGATMRSGGPYDGWWNGGLRNTATFHNTIAMLTEMIGSPTPTRIPLVLDRQIPTSDLAMPVPPQEWHFRQSIDYSITLNRATLDFASRLRENLLYDIYVMGKHSIERGSQDTWTANPRREAAIAAKLNPAAAGRGGRGGGAGGGRGGATTADQDMALWAAFHALELRDPRGYILPSDQVDFPTATKFVNTLLESGITVNRATRAFDVAGKQYPAGSYVVLTAQAFRPQIIDVFEAQVHPDVFPYPGALPTRPYDNAGWTMSYQMGIGYDRILDGFTGPFEKIGPWDVAPPVGTIASAGGATGYVTDNRVVNSFIATTRLLKANEDVLRLTAPLTVNGKTFGAGALYVRAKPTTTAALQRTLPLGVNYEGTTNAPPPDAVPLRTPRIGMWDVYGGNQDAGWMRWVLDTYEFPFDRVFAPALDAGNLDQKYDVLIFPQGGIPGTAGGGRGGGGAADAIPNLPAEYQGQVGRVTVEQTLPKIRDFLEKGGTVIAIGTSAANLAEFLKLPIENQLVENGAPLPATKIFIPGSVLTARVNASIPAANGMTEHTDVFFSNSPVFKLGADAAAKGVKAIAWFDTPSPLHSGWAWGQNYLENGVIAVEAPVGKGKVLLYTPSIIERGQPHQTFKLLFNGIYYSVMNK